MSIHDKMNTLVLEKCNRSLTSEQKDRCITQGKEMRDITEGYDEYIDVLRYEEYYINRINHNIQECHSTILELFLEKASIPHDSRPILRTNKENTDDIREGILRNSLISKLCDVHLERDYCIRNAQTINSCALINDYVSEYKLDKVIFTPEFLSRSINDYLYLDALKYFGSRQYQPFFNGKNIIATINRNNNIGFSDHIVQGIRESDVKSEALLQQIEYMFGPRAVNILDVGSSFGYISLYLSGKSFPHHNVHGVDSDERNTNLSTVTAKYMNIPARYETNIVDQKYVNSLFKEHYNVVLLTSILHHIGKQIGLGGTQQFLKSVHKKIPVMFIELASKNEKGLALSSHIPDNLNDYFNALDSAKVTLLGSFESMFYNNDGSSYSPREMYLIERGNIVINDKEYHIDKHLYGHFCRTNGYHVYTKGFVMSLSNKISYVTNEGFIKQEAFSSANLFNKNLQIIDVLREYISSNGKLQTLSYHPVLLDYEADYENLIIYQVYNKIDIHGSCDVTKMPSNYLCDRALVLKDYYNFGVIHLDISHTNFPLSKEGKVYAVDWDSVIFEDHEQYVESNQRYFIQYDEIQIEPVHYKDFVNNQLFLHCGVVESDDNDISQV
jgi:hypothetical protein